MDHQVRCAKHSRFYIVESKQIYELCVYIYIHIYKYYCFVYANHTTQRGPPATSQPTHFLARPLKKTTKELQNEACSRCGQNLERRPVLLASFAVAGVALMFATVTLQFFQNMSFNIWAGAWAGLQPFAYIQKAGLINWCLQGLTSWMAALCVDALLYRMRVLRCPKARDPKINDNSIQIDITISNPMVFDHDNHDTLTV